LGREAICCMTVTGLSGSVMNLFASEDRYPSTFGQSAGTLTLFL
jgi:hypothetical protein